MSGLPMEINNKVLIIEDDPDNREILTQILETLGYTVVGAENGKKALDLLQGEPLPSLILLDLDMPVMNGWEFKARLRQNPEWSQIPLYVLSAVADLWPKSQEDATVGYFVKPVNMDALLEALKKRIVAP